VVAYLDPPYNQHPYASNYHVLNSIALWDKPATPQRITPRTKSAIRTDWRESRRSAYNYRQQATNAYRMLLATINADVILTSYSTDGTIPLHDLLEANLERGHVVIELEGYKRYRVSTQRYSRKPMNVEFVVVLDPARPADTTADALVDHIRDAERRILAEHPETAATS
jgi:adenine-specific DNA-methyltransferase